MFLDRVKIFVKGGDGGNGIVAFRREKYVPYGGPSGGDGGRGGNVIIKVDAGLNTLIDFKYRRHYKAPRGEHGGGSNKSGRNASDLVLKVPPGTVVKDADTGEIIADLVSEGEEVIVARGGRGGRGNTRFATPTRKAPTFAEKGEPGEEKWIILELKLIADVGIIGLPNTGKSTLLSVLTEAKPKIADYPFTTLMPNLGVVKIEDGESFVMADIPGLIEGAHKGAGLGYQFLRHIERTKVFIHVLDGSGMGGRDPLKDFELVNLELKEYNEKLIAKPQIVAVNKMDLPPSKENYSRIQQELTEEGYKVFPISAVAKTGLKQMVYYVYEVLKREKAKALEEKFSEEKIVFRDSPLEEKGYDIKKEGEAFVIKGRRIERLAAMTDFNNEEALRRFQRIVQRMGIEDDLKELGIKEGDIVRIKDIEFEYYQS